MEISDCSVCETGNESSLKQHGEFSQDCPRPAVVDWCTGATGQKLASDLLEDQSAGLINPFWGFAL